MFKPTFTAGNYKPNGTAKIKSQIYKEEYILSLNMSIAFALSESWQISEGREVSIKIKGRNLNLMIRTFYGV